MLSTKILLCQSKIAWDIASRGIRFPWLESTPVGIKTRKR